MAIPRGDDFLIKRERAADEANAADDATITWMSPVGESGKDSRFRLLVVREDGDLVSVAPIPETKFKVGLGAWRWADREGGSPAEYVVVKTTPRRVDLRRKPA